MTHSGHDGEEELGSVGAGAPVGHTECVRAVVSQCGVELVLELASPDALTAHACARGVPRLDHEALNGKKDGDYISYFDYFITPTGNVLLKR